MNIALFITISANTDAAAVLYHHFHGEPLAFLADRPEVSSVELYTPEAGDVPLFTDGPGPPLIAQIDVDTAEEANSLINADEFSNLIMQASAFPAAVEHIELDVFETLHFPLPGESTPPPRKAPLSFVVRYYRPTEDETEFINYYTANHPPILATFPGIRNVLCYVPVEIKSAERFPDSGAFLGNEVVFDDLAALNNALASDVLTELKADGRKFKSFGSNAHHAMRRERVL